MRGIVKRNNFSNHPSDGEDNDSKWSSSSLSFLEEMSQELDKIKRNTDFNHNNLDNNSIGEKLHDHPFQEEEQLYQNFLEFTDYNTIIKQYNYTFKPFLKSEYSGDIINLEFFDYKISGLIGKRTNNDQIFSIRAELSQRWYSRLQHKIDAWQLKQIDNLRNELLKQFEDELDNIKQLEKSNDDSAGRLWNLAEGTWKPEDLEILEEYISIYQQDKAIQTIVKQLGRGNYAEEATTSGGKSIQQQDDSREEIGREELFSVKLSNEIEYLIPSELSLLTDELDTLFYLKLTENKLLNYDLTGSTRFKIEADENTKEISQHGPIILCVDTSGSMQGSPEKIAKTIAYGVAELAIQENRPCYIIAFSTSIATFTLNRSSSLEELAEFLTYSFKGGTSFKGPMKEAVRVLSEDKFGDADVLIVSDFVLGSLDNYSQLMFNRIREAEVDLHNLIISKSFNQNILQHFKNNWLYNPDERKFVDLENITDMKK